MKLHDIIKENHSFADAVAKLLLIDYREDPITGDPGLTIGDMSDDEYMEFSDHVDDVVELARKQNMQDPRQAIDSYTDTIRNLHKTHRH